MLFPSRARVASVDTGRIEVSGLTKRFGAVTAVNDLSFTVEPGTITGFLGPNGAGKTTTLRVLLGLVAADEGVARIGGRAYADFPAPNDQVGAALEATGFHPARSGRGHLRVYCTVNGYPLERADEVLELVGLTAARARPVRGYSLGMRQRLALAGALLGDPPVLILDEPANGLDPEGIAWMRRLLRDFADEGRTVLVSSHVLSEVQQLVDDVVIVSRGRLVGQGRLAELSGVRQAVTVRTPDADRLAGALTDEARVDRLGPGVLSIRGMTAAEIGRIAHARRVELHELAPARDGLEEAFLALTTDADSEAK